jgi:hypothetical protein
VLALQDGSADVTGELVATFYEPRFDFELSRALLEDSAHSGARWTLRDGETQLLIALPAEYVRGFLQSLEWAAQVGPLEEHARAGSAAP